MTNADMHPEWIWFDRLVLIGNCLIWPVAGYLALEILLTA